MSESMPNQSSQSLLELVRERRPRNRTDLDLAIHAQIARVRRALYRGPIRDAVNRLFFTDIVERTDSFNDITWLGKPVWQNILDLWIIQETIAEVRPSLLLETGTNRG